MTKAVHTVVASAADAGARLDKFLSAQLPALSRSRLQNLIAEGHVTQAGQTIDDASRKIKPGQEFTVTIPETAPSHIVAQEIPLDIIFEDEDILILNKPPGLTVHPAPGHPDMTLVNALLAHCGDSLSGIGGVARPGIVHRIDKETSGLLAVAKNDTAHAALSAQLASRTMKRTYVAVVWSAPVPKQGTIKGNIGRSPKNRQKMAVVKTGGKPAVTHYRVLKTLGPCSLVECTLETGRTHQIRVHLAHAGHALVGDPVYGSKRKPLPIPFERQALHARKLGLIHPRTQKPMEFECELPADMQALIAALQ